MAGRAPFLLLGFVAAFWSRWEQAGGLSAALAAAGPRWLLGPYFCACTIPYGAAAAAPPNVFIQIKPK